MDNHHVSNHLSPRFDETLNYFDEQVFAHSSNGNLLAIHPRHITLSESRSLGSIPGVVKDWVVTDTGHQVLLAVKDRRREIIFRVNLASDPAPRIVLRQGMTLYMRFSWDKLIEYRDDRPSWQHQIPL
ncbi:MAG: hypothetical protein ABFD81_03760 [Syntrophaceae bacterium]